MHLQEGASPQGDKHKVARIAVVKHGERRAMLCVCVLACPVTVFPGGVHAHVQEALAPYRSTCKPACYSGLSASVHSLLNNRTLSQNIIDAG